jgi:hypothetical protein
MTTHQQAIRDRLDEFGWELAGHDDMGAWWADDAWRLRSIWSPQDCEIYLTFLVDPQANLHSRKAGESVWAVKASASRPTQAQKADGDYVLDFGHGWRDRIAELFSILARMRHEYVA